MVSFSSELKATGALLPMVVDITERLLTGDALALADVELPMLDGAAGVGVVDDPFVATADAATADAVVFPVEPLMFFVASFTSWNFSINCK